MTIQYYERLFDYDARMNQKVYEQITNTSLDLSEAKEIFTHLIAAKQVWIRRLQKESLEGIEIWPDFEAGEVEKQMLEAHKQYREFLSDLSEERLAQDLVYRNSKGKEFRTAIRDILTHVIIHGEHHRGQVAKLVRQAGGDPLNTDYITYVRNLD